MRQTVALSVHLPRPLFAEIEAAAPARGYTATSRIVGDALLDGLRALVRNRPVISTVASPDPLLAGSCPIVRCGRQPVVRPTIPQADHATLVAEAAARTR